MDKMNVYTIFDKVAKLHGPMFEAINDGVAVRHYRQLIRTVDPASQGEFVLKHIAMFDRSEEGQVELVPERIVELPAIEPVDVSAVIKSNMQRVAATKRGI